MPANLFDGIEKLSLILTDANKLADDGKMVKVGLIGFSFIDNKRPVVVRAYTRGDKHDYTINIDGQVVDLIDFIRLSGRL